MRRATLLRTLPLLLLATVLLIAVAFQSAAFEVPGSQITYNYTETAPVPTAGSSTTQGGTFTTLILNTTSQTPRWKAYVGNASGILTLDDAFNNTIYDWGLATTTGQVYASRSNNIDWDSVRCLQDPILLNEQDEMNMSATMIDNINKTFNDTIHADFYVGTTYFPQSGCRAIATFTNDARQTPSPTADFQEVLLDDTANVIYTALLENNQQGFDSGAYDFQMIVPESDVQTTPHTYYFYTEFR